MRVETPNMSTMSVKCTVYTNQCTVFSVYSMYNAMLIVQCSFDHVQGSVLSMGCAVCSGIVKHAEHFVQSTG